MCGRTQQSFSLLCNYDLANIRFKVIAFKNNLHLFGFDC